MVMKIISVPGDRAALLYGFLLTCLGPGLPAPADEGVPCDVGADPDR